MQQRVFLCHIFLCFQKSNIFLSLFRTKSRLYRGEHTAMVLCSQSVPVRLPASLYRLSGATGWPEEPIVLTSEGGLVGVVRDVAHVFALPAPLLVSSYYYSNYYYISTGPTTGINSRNRCLLTPTKTLLCYFCSSLGNYSLWLKPTL